MSPPLWCSGVTAMSAEPWHVSTSQAIQYHQEMQGHVHDASLYWMVPASASPDCSLTWAYQQLHQPFPSNAQDLETKAAELEIVAGQITAAARKAKNAAQEARVTRGDRQSCDGLETMKKGSKGANMQKQSKSMTHAQDSLGDMRDDERTTLMLRNLPNDYTRDMVKDLLDSCGFVGSFDFLYLPVDFHRWAGFGYAFVNMVSNADAERARDYFHGFSAWSVGSHKICEVCWGVPHQGFEKHCELYRNSPVMHESVSDEFKPAVFHQGQRAPFPAPTKRIRPPRTKTRPPSFANKTDP